MAYDNVDLWDLEPTVVTRDLQNKYLLIYGKPKIGKTSFAAKLPNNLFLATERGLNAQSGKYVKYITSWNDFKRWVRQLKDPRAQEKFKTVTIDTLTILWNLCEKFICQNNGVEALADVPYGKGYKLLSREFEDTLRELTMLPYGIILIAHATIRLDSRSDEEGGSVEIIGPSLDKRCTPIVNAMVDVIGYIGETWDENNESHRFLWTRSTPTITAGTRFPYLPKRIPFGYEELSKALADAIEKQATEDGDIVVDRSQDLFAGVQNVPFAELMDDAKKTWLALVEKAKTMAEDEATALVNEMNNIVRMNFGHDMKLSQATSSQRDQVEMALSDLKELL